VAPVCCYFAVQLFASSWPAPLGHQTEPARTSRENVYKPTSKKIENAPTIYLTCFYLRTGLAFGGRARMR
jgi:hypothetical protein